MTRGQESGLGRFSLILATVGREEEIRHFLASLYAQTYRDFDLIVIDQNSDDRLSSILAMYENRFQISHLRSEKKGAARARNLGLENANGDIVGFPDDDCWYPSELLATVAQYLDKHPEKDGITGRSTDDRGRNSNGRYDTHPGPIDKINVWGRAIEYAMFLRASSIEGLKFDEEIGVGAGTPWGSGEGTDYLLRLLDQGASINYSPHLSVFHSPVVPSHVSDTSRKAYDYGRGTGFLIRKYKYPLWFKAKWIVRPFGGALLSLIRLQRAEARYRWLTFRGRLDGMLS